MPDDGENFDWLESLLGDSPLLSDSEWKFILDIRNKLVSEAKSKPIFCPEDESLDIKQKLSILKDNFTYVINHLKVSPKSRQNFLDNYPNWQKVREINVNYLKKIAKSVQSDKEKCQTASLVGSCASFIGSGVLLASGAHRLAPIAGCAMVGLGSVTSLGSSVTEISLLHKWVTEAEGVLKDDREYSKHLWEWLSDASHLQEAIEKIRYINVPMNMKFAANIFQDAFKKGRKKTDIEKLIKSILTTLNFSPETIEDISNVIAILIASSMLYDHYRPYFNLAVLSHKSMVRLRVVVNLFRTAVSVNSALSIKDRVRLTQDQKRKIISGMALDAVNIFLLSNNWKSESKEAVKIFEAADILQKEAEIFRKLFIEMDLEK